MVKGITSLFIIIYSIISPIVANPQTINKDGYPYMLIYDDAKIVNRALELIYASKFDSAKNLLEEVIARIPDDYSHDYFSEGKHYIEFWDADELWTYCELTKDSTIYATQNAYSRALFWSAWTNFHTGEIQKAKEEILAAQILEPDNPTILCEAAIIQLNQKDSISTKIAFFLYHRALNSREYITPLQKARALRGLGLTSVEMGYLEDARVWLTESLEYENSQIAVKELEYIDHLVKGGKKWKIEVVTPDTL